MKAGYRYNPSELYTNALDRVERSDVLKPYKDIIMHDWSEGDDHLRWVIEEDEKDIEYWAKCIRNSMN
jgi:hypothetical protein